ncbi:hypothetical protein ACI6PS_02425 [Flavobacterium sp. PLA-1-15]|uniref:hypothetical protein n=1 Tax=Flavobacterium sp. PLA-1-15 TaxID=3380533 RepID=UPI003B7B16DB
METNLNSLNDKLFDTLDRLSKGDIKREDAKAINEIAGTIINNAKVQLDAFKATRGFGAQAKMFGVLHQGNTPELPEDAYQRKVEFSIYKGFTNVGDCMANLGKLVFEKEFRDWEKSLKE